MSLDSQLFVIVWGSYVRIGSAADPIDRLARVADTPPPQRRGNPELIGTVPGGHGGESWFRAMLSPYKAGPNGWYHLRGAVVELVDAAMRSGVEDLAPKARGPVRMRSGDALFVVTSARGNIGERREHLMLMPEKTPPGLRLVAAQPAICGAGVSRVIAQYDGAASANRCRECNRSVPARAR